MALYCERPEWDDVEIVPQKDTPNPAVKISYSESFADCHGYLRAVMLKGEKTARVVELTKTCIKHNPANYTAWMYRREAILESGACIETELAEVGEMCRQFPKNFQIWHHRAELLKKLGHPHCEKSLTAEVLEEDAKNYHVWAHRRWLVSYFDDYDGEVEFAEGHIESDFRNNSAFTYLFFLKDAMAGQDPAVRRAMHAAEVRRAVSLLAKDTENEACHNYLLGHAVPRAANASGAAEAPADVLRAVGAEVEAALAEVVAADPEALKPRATLADLYVEAVRLGVEEAKPAEGAPPRVFSPTAMGGGAVLRRAAALYTHLAAADPIRAKYWCSVAAEAEGLA